MAENKTKKGFSLVEAAIVLGIMGIVIGGVWAVASSVQEKKRQVELSEGMIQIVDGVRKTYHNKPLNLALWDSVPLGEYIFTAEITPPNWGDYAWWGAYNQRLPYSGLDVSAGIGNWDIGNVVLVDLTGSGLTRDFCDRFLSFFIPRAERSRLASTVIVGDSDVTYTSPVDVSAISCPAFDFWRIQFVFHR